jgi:high-affinity iron transporter
MDYGTITRSTAPGKVGKLVLGMTLAASGLLLVSLLVWEGITTAGSPDPGARPSGSVAAVIDIGILVFREGLECVLVLSAITAGMTKSGEPHVRPVATGVGVAFLTTLLTWYLAVGIVDDLTKNVNALFVQAATGLLAVVVLLVVMNWFFHRVYWTGWISMHTKRKHALLEEIKNEGSSGKRLLFGMGLLGFTSFYREGVEVVLFLQSYRLRFGGAAVFSGVIIGSSLTGIVAILTVVAHRRLPYRRMLVLTGVLLGLVLLVMVGEQAQEMQLAHWLPTTEIPWLVAVIPAWMRLWFSLFPTVQTLTAQAFAAVLVLGSYVAARRQN